MCLFGEVTNVFRLCVFGGMRKRLINRPHPLPLPSLSYPPPHHSCLPNPLLVLHHHSTTTQMTTNKQHSLLVPLPRTGGLYTRLTYTFTITPAQSITMKRLLFVLIYDLMPSLFPSSTPFPSPPSSSPPSSPPAVYHKPTVRQITDTNYLIIPA